MNHPNYGRIDYQYPKSRMPKTTNEAMKTHLSLSCAPKRYRVAEWVNRVRTTLHGAGNRMAGWFKPEAENIEPVSAFIQADEAWSQPLGYDYRTDGNFLIRQTCFHCGDTYSVHALSQATSFKLCQACDSVRIMEKERQS